MAFRKSEHLNVDIKNGKLVITIGTKLLCFSVGSVISDYKITNGGATMTDNERPQANNALVPLDFQVIFDMLFDRTQYSVDSCKDIAEEICAKFGKDNSGMVPINRYEFITICSKYLGNPAGWPKHIHDCFDEILDTFSQQPPKEPVYDCGCGMGESCLAIKKERKVSLEEMAKILYESINPLSNYEKNATQRNKGFYMATAQVILTRLNATEERKGDKCS
jgi:hypothetical protein